MKRFLPVLLFAVSLHAQPMEFGEPFALTNTRYPSGGAFDHVLRSDGRDSYLFWTTRYAVRMTVLDGTRRAGVPTVGTVQFGQFDAVWVGTHFIVASTSVRNRGMLGTQAFSARGEALSTPYLLAERAEHPRLAWNGATLLLLYLSDGVLRSLPLGKDGRPVDGAREIVAEQILSRAEVTATANGFAAVVPRTGVEMQLTTFNASGRIVSSGPLKPQDYGESAIAYNGRETLAVWNGGSSLEGAIVRGDGTAKLFAVQSWQWGARLSRPAVAWSGTEWVVAYTNQTEEYGVRKDTLHVARVDREGTVTAREETQGWHNTALLRTADGVRIAFRADPNVSNPALLLSTLPFEDHEAEPVTYVASTQEFAATATSADATLFVWQETGDDTRTAYAGLRGPNGEWRERRLGENMHVYGAASNGSTFAVFVEPINVLNSYAVMALDSKLRTLWTTPVARQLRSLASNGEGYAVAGVDHNLNVVAVPVSSSGVLGTPSIVSAWDGSNDVATEAHIASDGEGFFVTWLKPACVHLSCAQPVTVHGARLNASLQRVDATDLHLNGAGQPHVYRLRLVFDGTRYIAVWPASDSLFSAVVPPSGTAQPSSREVMKLGNVSVGPMTGLRNGAALTWRAYDEAADHVVFLSGDGAFAGKASFAWTQSDELPKIGRTPDGRAMYVTTRVQAAAPHHTITRLLAAVEDPIPIDPPDAPSLTARSEGNGIVLRWTPPAQPVSGYRLEYRIGDGSWNELDRWFEATERQMTFRPSGSVPHAFRMRAWSDAGTSAYSNAATTQSKRRAVGLR